MAIAHRSQSQRMINGLSGRNTHQCSKRRTGISLYAFTVKPRLLNRLDERAGERGAANGGGRKRVVSCRLIAGGLARVPRALSRARAALAASTTIAVAPQSRPGNGSMQFFYAPAPT